jgi:hypothetical protein
MDIADLRAALEDGATIEKIADFLMRDVEEVQRKMAKLDLHSD